MDTQSDIVIVGCGASGALLCAELFRQARSAINVSCLDLRSRLGVGLAYGTLRDEHQLNVPASRMSSRVDQPDHFVQWLQKRRLLEGQPDKFFARRRDFADYLTDSLGQSLRESRHHHGLHHEPHRAVAIHRIHGGWIAALDDGRLLWCERMVLGLGNLPPVGPPPGLAAIADAPGYCHDPWDGSLPVVDPDVPVAVIGSGLSGVDMVLTLVALGHRGPIHVISRHGRWPASHAGPHPPLDLAWTSDSLSDLFGRLRANISRQPDDWRRVIDSIRPKAADLWRGLSEIEKRRFLRHLMSHWQRARHRMPPATERRLQALEASGQLTLHASRRLGARVDDELILLELQGGSKLAVDTVINATGSCNCIDKSHQPLLEQMLAEGVVRPGPASLGLDCTVDGQILNAQGLPQPGLWTLGPLRQGEAFETTAIPEIRVQARDLASRLLACA